MWLDLILTKQSLQENGYFIIWYQSLQRRDDGFHVDWINTLLNNIHYNSFLSPHSHTVTKMVIRNLPRSTYSEFFWKFVGHILSSPNTNITPSGLTIHPEHPVFQGSNLDMVDRGVLDSVPDVLETWNLKHDTSRAYSTYRMCLKNILSSKDPTWNGG